MGRVDVHGAALAAAYDAAVAACHPDAALPGRFPEAGGRRVLILGAGKPAAAMARAAERHYLASGVEVTGAVVTAYGHGLTTSRVAVLEAAHPVPDEASVAAASRLLELADAAGEDRLVVCLIGGGGSSLLCAPDGITLRDKVALTRALLASGADIGEINAVRKHLSAVKGGRLAARSHPALVRTLALSDVVGDDPGTIAAGPTWADETTFADALAVLDKFAIHAPAARVALRAGVSGDRPETLKRGDPRLANVGFEVVASNAVALEVAAASLGRAGYAVEVEATPETGEARGAAAERARRVAAILIAGGPRAPCVTLSGGEVTVTLAAEPTSIASGGDEPGGRGGPNCEYALAFAGSLRAELERALGHDAALAALGRVALLSADSDGVDGASGAAGALLGVGQLPDLDAGEIAAALATHATGDLLRAHGAALERGPTLTNVNDLRFVLLVPEGASALGYARS